MLASRPPPAGRLLSGLATSAERLAAIPYASMAVVALGSGASSRSGSGLLVPPGQLPTVKAVTHSSKKWAWVARAGQPTLGAGCTLVRASVGRLGEERLLQVGDAELVDRTVAELRGCPAGQEPR